MTFADLNIDADIVEALASKGILEPFPIQEQTIPLALGGQDIIGQAKPVLVRLSASACPSFSASEPTLAPV